MCNSTKIADSPELQKFGLHSTPKNSKDRFHQSFITPKMTPSPVRLDMYTTPPKPHILSPRRYSLSDIATPPRITKRESINRSSFLHNVSGPLLASTKFNINVSTYEETKSPGLAGRIVQYNQETENLKDRIHPPTHQAKYGSPGLFPIVHLFKKSPPTLEQRPKRLKVRISSPGYTRQQSEDYKLKLLEGIVKPRSINRFNYGYQEHLGEASTSTRSVLDALKEISRKRIHASEDHDIDTESGKRQRTELLSGLDTNKRSRDETSPLDSPTSPSKPVSKRACMYDEYAASCSSTVYAIKKCDLGGTKRKSISTSTLFENPKETKQVKLINVETQTNVEVEKDNISNENEKLVEQSQDIIEENDEEPTKKRESPLRVFDDAPLERIRKNRLAALMGSLTGKDPILAPKPTFSSILNGNTEKSDSQNIQTSADELDNTEKPLVSILTTKKLLHKSDKHVHFNIPETSSFTSSSDIKTSNNPSNSTPNKNTLTLVSISQASNNLSLIAPPSSPVSLKPPETNEIDNGSKVCSVVSLPLIQETSVQAKSTSNMITPFGNLSSSSGLTTPPFVVSMSNAISTSAVSPPAVKSPTSSLKAPSLTSPAKVGGFKFDLSTSKTDVSKTTTLNTNITAMSSSQSAVALIPFGKLNSTVNSVSSTVRTTITTTTSTGLTFGTTTTASSSGPLSSSSVSPFKFGVFTSESQTKTNSTTLEVKNIVAGSTFAFGGTSTTFSTTTSASAITTSSVTTQDNKTPAFSFNAPKISSMTTNTPAKHSTFSFGNQKETPITKVSFPTTTIHFGAAVTNSSVISNNMTVANGNGFGITTSSTFGGSNLSSGLGSSTASSGFGASAPSSVFGTSTPSFGISNVNTVDNSISQISTNVTSKTCFGAPTTAVNIFGSPSITTSGTFEPSTTSSNYAAPTTGGFGLNTSSTGPSFGATNNPTGFGGFGALQKPAPGSFPTTDASSTGGFSSTSTPIFGGTVTISSSFGNSATMTSSPFSNTSIPAFGQKAPPSSFGSTTTTAAASFGSTSNTFNNPSTTSSSVFGTSSGFGSSLNSSTNIFGGTSTTQTAGFGTSNTIFATTSTVSPFENKATTTNSTAIFSFGAKTTTASGNGFGANSSSTGGFGSNNTFLANSNNFGNANAFGTSNVPTTTQPSGFATQSTSFGAPANQGFGIENKSASNQGFGMENKAVFGNTAPSFGANTSAAAAPPIFGSNTASSAFGTSTNNAPPFAANTANSGFGKPQGTTFGAVVPNNFSSTTGGFGSNQAQNQTQGPFGNTNAPAGSSTPVFNFGSGATPKPGVFSFGGPSSGELSKPTFNFSSGNGAPAPAPAFGAGSSFGGTSSFGNTGPPQFGTSSAASTNMFNIGTGSPSTRNRTMIRAKRRN